MVNFVKVLSLFIVLILAASSNFLIIKSNAQTISKDAPTPQWMKTYGPYGSDIVVQTSDGGYAIVGANATHNIHGYSSFWPLLIKTDSLGEMQWSNGYPSTHGFTANSIIQTTDGGFIICGQGDWLLKVNSLGNIVWQKTLGLGLREYVDLFAIRSSQGDVIIAGTISNSTTGGSDALIVKADQDCNVLWKQMFSINSKVGPLSIYAASITETPDNGYVLVGSWDSLGGIQPWLAKTDSKGNLLLNRTYSELSHIQVFRSVVAEPNGGFTLTADNPSIVENNQIFMAWFLKADNNGNVTKSLSYDSRVFRSLTKTSDDSYIALQDAFILEFDNSGELLYNVSFASIGRPSSVIQTSDENYVITGISSLEGNLQTIFLAKLSSSALFGNLQDTTSTIPKIFFFAVLALLLVIVVAIILVKKKMDKMLITRNK